MTDETRPDTPLRLARAAALAFPNGGMTEKGLRREHARGRLIIERSAGKDYTTLAYIEEMRRRCRLSAAVAPSPSSESQNEKLQALLRSIAKQKERLKAEATERRIANANERAEKLAQWKAQKKVKP